MNSIATALNHNQTSVGVNVIKAVVLNQVSACALSITTCGSAHLYSKGI